MSAIAGMIRLPAGERAQDHSVTLPERALEMFRNLVRVLLGGKARQPLSNTAMLEIGPRHAARLHGGRIPQHLQGVDHRVPNHSSIFNERALAHTILDKIEKADRRRDPFEKRKRLMCVWATYCTRSAVSIAPLATHKRRL